MTRDEITASFTFPGISWSRNGPELLLPIVLHPRYKYEFVSVRHYKLTRSIAACRIQYLEFTLQSHDLDDRLAPWTTILDAKTHGRHGS